MALITACVLLVAFAANVAYGSIAGNPVLGNVAEMLLLFAASVLFVISILAREARDKKTKNTN